MYPRAAQPSPQAPRWNHVTSYHQWNENKRRANEKALHPPLLYWLTGLQNSEAVGEGGPTAQKES